VLQGRIYRSRPIGVDAVSLAGEPTRVDIEFHGVDPHTPSMEGRVFINNPDADENTPVDADSGYAGSFFIFGHGGAFRAHAGHGEGRTERPAYDPRRPHAAPSTEVVTATDAVRRALDSGAEEINVTVVPLVVGGAELSETEDIFKFERLSIVAYRAEGAESNATPLASSER
jgi:hypothetical protein